MTRLIDADGLKNTFWHGDLVPNKEMYHISEIKYAIDNAPTVFFDWEKSDAYLDCVKRIKSLEKENEELRQFIKKQGGRL